MPAARRIILRYEVHQDGAAWVVASVDASGNRYIICDCDDAVQAHLRAAYLGRKLRLAKARISS